MPSPRRTKWRRSVVEGTKYRTPRSRISPLVQYEPDCLRPTFGTNEGRGVGNDPGAGCRSPPSYNYASPSGCRRKTGKERMGARNTALSEASIRTCGGAGHDAKGHRRGASSLLLSSHLMYYLRVHLVYFTTQISLCMCDGRWGALRLYMSRSPCLPSSFGQERVRDAAGLKPRPCQKRAHASLKLQNETTASRSQQQPASR
jgi:hypothetical protein